MAYNNIDDKFTFGMTDVEQQSTVTYGFLKRKFIDAANVYLDSNKQQSFELLIDGCKNLPEAEAFKAHFKIQEMNHPADYKFWEYAFKKIMSDAFKFYIDNNMEV